MTGPSRASRRLLDRLQALFPQSSQRTLKQWLEADRVQVNGRVVRGGHVAVADSDRVAVAPHPPPEFPRALRRVHEDTEAIVIDKPPGLLTIATETEQRRTVYRMLSDYVAAQHPPRRLFIVHRLDRETSGLLVFAKSPAAKRHLQLQFRDRTVDRSYVALVEGVVSEGNGTLESRLVEDRDFRFESPVPAGFRRAVAGLAS